PQAIQHSVDHHWRGDQSADRDIRSVAKSAVAVTDGSPEQQDGSQDRSVGNRSCTPGYTSDSTCPSPRGPDFAGRGSSSTYMPADTAPESVSGLSPTMRVRSGSTRSRSHAVRNRSRAGLHTPCPNDITTASK